MYIRIIYINSRLSCACLRQYRTLGSTIVDGPEVPEDRDPAQREAEGPRSSMDYSEFPLLHFSHPKNRRSSVTTPRNRRSVRRPMEGSEVTMALYGTVGEIRSQDRRSQHGDCPRAAKTTTRQATLSQQFRT